MLKKLLTRIVTIANSIFDKNKTARINTTHLIGGKEKKRNMYEIMNTIIRPSLTHAIMIICHNDHAIMIICERANKCIFLFLSIQSISFFNDTLCWSLALPVPYTLFCAVPIFNAFERGQKVRKIPVFRIEIRS